jgi:hypothetical protein
MLFLRPGPSLWADGDRTVACVLATSDTKRDASGAVVEAGDVSFAKLGVGDCFNDPEHYAAAVRVPAVPCNQLHDNEVYAALDAEGDEFPGDEAMEADAQAACEERLDSYLVGLSDGSDLLAFPFFPTQESWTFGDRQITCVLYNADLSKLTGSRTVDG